MAICPDEAAQSGAERGGSVPSTTPETPAQTLAEVEAAHEMLTDSAPIGECGTSSDRDSKTGRFRRGNRASLVVGERSMQFWAAVEGARTDIRAAVLRDRGFREADAPEALQRVADGFAQAVLIRDSAWARVAEDGGPLSSSSRPRRALQVWKDANTTVLHFARILGIDRVGEKRIDLPRMLSGLDRS